MMKISARNVIKGKVIQLKTGPIAAQVRVDIGGGNSITSVVTASAIDDLGIKEGSEVSVVIKASDVLLAV